MCNVVKRQHRDQAAALHFAHFADRADRSSLRNRTNRPGTMDFGRLGLIEAQPSGRQSR